jgi:glycerol-3-phosphate acyltransferase PlsY
VLGLAYLAGAVPFSNVAARLLRGVDLRELGTGTVSGTALYRIAGFAPLAVAGSLDVAKGAVGPLLAGRDRPVLAALAGGAAVAGHDWSPFLGFAGGRGISPALGALAVNAPAGVAVLGLGLAGGRLARRTSLGCFLAYLALVPVLARVHGRRGALAGAAVLVPIIAKRLAGNAPPPAGPERARVLWNRLVHDQDEAP